MMSTCMLALSLPIHLKREIREELKYVSAFGRNALEIYLVRWGTITDLYSMCSDAICREIFAFYAAPSRWKHAAFLVRRLKPQARSA